MSGYLVSKLYDVVKGVLPMNWEDTEESGVVVALENRGEGDCDDGDDVAQSSSEYGASGKTLQRTKSILATVKRNKDSVRAKRVMYDMYKENKVLEANLYMHSTKRNIKSAVGGCITENTGLLVSSMPRIKKRTASSTSSTASSIMSNNSNSTSSTGSTSSDVSIHLISKQKIITRADLINFNKRKYNIQSEFAILDR